MVIPIEERFMRHVEVGEGCWLWTGQTMGKARRYGGFRVGTRSTDTRSYAHRVSHELFVGPIPEGFHVDHVKARGCTSTLCVNPAHLEAVPPRTNWQRTRKEVCVHGHDLTVPRNVLWDKLGRRRGCAQCNRDRMNALYAARKEG